MLKNLNILVWEKCADPLTKKPSLTFQVGVLAGVFHGGKSLCESQKTVEKLVSKDGNVEWEEDLSFDLKVCDIPRMARLCFVVYEILKSCKGVRARRLKDSKQVCL